jgi:2'-5' RNA ligase
VPEALLPALCAAAARVRTGALAQPLDRLELWGGARLCCAAGDAVSALKDLQQALVIVATDLGISIESREFIAHVTLARSRARLPEAVARRFRPPLRIVARELVLAESGAAIAGRRYRRLGSWPLG